MLSFRSNETGPIAIIQDAQHDNNRLIYINEKKQNQNSIEDDFNNYMASHNYKATKKDLIELLTALRANKTMVSSKLQMIYNDLKETILSEDFEELELKSGHLSIIPQNIPGQVQNIFVTGPSGSGKSVFTSKYINNYHVMFPENRIFVVSKKKEDPAFDQFDYIKRIPLDDPVELALLDVAHFENSLVVFDDIENIMDKTVRKIIYELKGNLLETGRSKGVYVVICAHIALGNLDTKKDLNECQYFVIFADTSVKAKKSLLETYVGLNARNIKKVAGISNRWVMVKKNNPMYVITDDKVFVIDKKF